MSIFSLITKAAAWLAFSYIIMFRRLLCKRRGTLCIHRPGLTLKVPVWRGKNYITRTLKNQDLILYFHNLYTTFPILTVMYFVWIIRNEFDLCSLIWYNRAEYQKRKSICELFLTRKRAFGENQNWLLILGLNFVIIEVKFIFAFGAQASCEDYVNFKIHYWLWFPLRLE